MLDRLVHAPPVPLAAIPVPLNTPSSEPDGFCRFEASAIATKSVEEDGEAPGARAREIRPYAAGFEALSSPATRFQVIPASVERYTPLHGAAEHEACGSASPL